jgi:transcriptional regulator with XRE-family HTH domain
MDPEQAQRLGSYLRERREARGITLRQLGLDLGVDKTQILRLEQGAVASPRADLLAGIAAGLDLPVADVYGMAGYAASDELPSFTPYLRAKYRELPEDAVVQLERYFARLARKYGTAGPADGEDEER